MVFYIAVLVLMAVLAVLNAIVPLPGFNFFVPLFSTVMSTNEAITFITVYFLINSSIIVFVFKEYLQKNLVLTLIPSSFLGALAGGLLSSSLDELALTFVVLLFVSYFSYKKVRNIHKQNRPRKSSQKGTLGIGMISGFLQGGGFGGGDIRNSYLYANGLSLQQVRATTAAVGVSIFLVSLSARAMNGSFNLGHMWLYVFLIPIAIVAAYVGKHLTTRLGKNVQNTIVLVLMGLSVILLVYKLTSLIIA